MKKIWRSNRNPQFRSEFSETIFDTKYKHEGAETMSELADTLVEDVCTNRLSEDDKATLKNHIAELRFIPGGRYLYYCGAIRKKKFFNNCFLLNAEDTREGWSSVVERSIACLMSGGGIGVNYDWIRESGSPLSATGGTASGPISLMEIINEAGRRVMQGGSRRSAIYASLNWQHGDIKDFLVHKNWDDIPIGNTGISLADLKAQDFNAAAPLDMTNISVCYDNAWLNQFVKTGDPGEIFKSNIKQAMRTSEPGFSFNFDIKEGETFRGMAGHPGQHQDEVLRNACTEVTSFRDDDSDVCNLGSINIARVESKEQMREIVELATKFLVCGTLVADVPYERVAHVRQKNRRLGLGIMAMHEWLLQRRSGYEVTSELHEWLDIYKTVSRKTADEFADSLSVSRPVKVRAIAPTGTIGILAGPTTTGIEPIYATAFKRRYLKQKKWHYQYVVDAAADSIIEQTGCDPESIDTALSMSDDPERRIKFQADVQDYVDHSISSTCNLPAWGSETNNEDRVDHFAGLVAKYAPRLRGMTFYADGSRGGQPLTAVPYSMAVEQLGNEYEESLENIDPCRDGVCGV